MMAARLHEWGKPLRIDEVPVPEIGDRDVLIRVKACGLNGGDPHFVNQDVHLTPGGERKTPIRRLPIIMGHHAAGVVARVGQAAQIAIHEGDHVVISAGIKCGFCPFCLSGVGRCENGGTIGFTLRARSEYGLKLAEETYREGALAEFLKLPATNVHKIPDSLPFHFACKIQSLALGFRAAKEGGVRPGRTVIVNGASGGSGLPTLFFCKLFGASKIIAVARNRERLERAAELVDASLIDVVTTDEDIQKRIMELTEDRGSDILIDYIPRGVRVTQQCIYTVRYGGQVVLVGGCTEEIPLSYRYVMSNEINIKGCHYSLNEVKEVARLVEAGALEIPNFVTHRFPLERVNEAFETMQNSRENPIWVVVEP